MQAAVPGVDHLWLEQRFAEVSKRIDESLNDIRPDQGFFAIGQRVDQLEQHFSSLFDGVATRGDVEGVRLIEAHVSELAGHLENAHQQLMRLDVIEDHLAGIAGKLEDVHRAAMFEPNEPAAAMSVMPEIDLQSVARTAAEAAAQQFAKLQPQLMVPQNDGSELRDMLRGFISESRQGEENTSALLDTLQQAMIRLLDRVDAMEFSAIQSAHAQAQAQPAPQEYVREQVRFGVDQNVRHGGHIESEPVAALDAAVAAVASAKTMSSPFAQASGGPDGSGPMLSRGPAPAESAQHKSPEKLRQDFIAEARRAKMRLAAEGENDLGEVTLERPDMRADAHTEPSMTADAPKGPVSNARPAVKAASGSAGKSAVGPAITPRLKVLALGAVLALVGAWYTMQIGRGPARPIAATGAPAKVKAPGTSSSLEPASSKAATKEAKSDIPQAPTEDRAPADAAITTPDDGSKPMNVQPGTRGEIVTDEITVGSTT
ncbi:MAG: hypothetical protein ABL893_16680, partial [Hyphomicrobium sp.]